MSLNWNLTAVKDRKSIDDEGVRGVLDALIYGTMFVGMGEISGDENSKCYYKRFAARLEFFQKINGVFVHGMDDDGKPIDVMLNEEHCKRFIGLTTNVSYETPAAWLKHIMAEKRRTF